MKENYFIKMCDNIGEWYYSLEFGSVNHWIDQDLMRLVHLDVWNKLISN